MRTLAVPRIECHTRWTLTIEYLVVKGVLSIYNRQLNTLEDNNMAQSKYLSGRNKSESVPSNLRDHDACISH